MNLTELLNKIVLLPLTFEEVGNKSIHTLLKESGYFCVHDKILEDDLLKILEDKPEYVDIWVDWSDDKRSYGGWYFLEADKGTYEICIIDSNYKKKDCIEFSDKRKACAAYIKREIEKIRMH
jgi:hypothetical protein